MSENTLQRHWHQHGTISLWRYIDNPRSYFGWHLSADAVGCSSLLDLLQSLVTSQESVYRTVQVTPPSATLLQVPNCRSAKWVALSKWRIGVEQSENARELWRVETEEDLVHLTLGRDTILELIHGVEAISRGEGDYSIGGNDRDSLWLWWWPPSVAQLNWARGNQMSQPPG